MSLVTVLQRHARYNRWAYAQLLSDLPAEVFSSPLPIPFRTLRAALTHALAAEILWYSRILGLADVGGFNVTRDLVPLWHGEIGDGQWDSVSCCSTVSELACLISEQSDRWDAFLHSSSDASLDNFFSYIDTRGTSYTRRWQRRASRLQSRDASSRPSQRWSVCRRHRGPVHGFAISRGSFR